MAYDPGGNAVAAMAAAIAAAGLTLNGYDARFTLLALLLVLSMLLPPSLVRELPLVAILGVVALIKTSLLALAIFAVAMTILVRRRAIDAVVFLAALLGAWLAAHQHLAGIPRFLRWSFEVARGYAGASSSGDGVPIALACAAGLALVIIAVERVGVIL